MSFRKVVGVRLDPASVDACPEAVEAVLEADWVVFGPGSWFTSVIPHLLVPGIAKALAATNARCVVTLNMSAQTGETEGFSPTTHLEVLAAHAPDLAVDVVLAARRATKDGMASLEAGAAGLGAQLVVAHLGADQSVPTHDPQLLAAAYESIFTTQPEVKRGKSEWR